MNISWIKKDNDVLVFENYMQSKDERFKKIVLLLEFRYFCMLYYIYRYFIV